MKRFVPLILDTVAMLALAVWLGGLAFIWLAWFPAARIVPEGRLPLAFAETLRRFSSVIELCGLTLAGIQWLLRRRYQGDRSRFVGDGVRFLLTFAALFCVEYMKLTLLPQMKNPPPSGLFFAMEVSAAAQGVLLTVIAGLTVWLQAARSAASPAPPAASPQPNRPAPTPSRRRQGR